LSPARQAALPSFWMTVFVLGQYPARRFLPIDPLEYAEGEETQQGLKIVQVMSEGVVPSFQASPFYARR
jgi:hypothetical protein